MRKIAVQRRFEQLQIKTRIASQLRAFHPEMRKTLLENIADLTVALAQARHVHLAKIAEKLNRGGKETSREQWVRRQLDNDTMDTWDIFRPLAECLLKGLVGHSVYLILDPTDLDAERCVVMVMLAYHGRALPLLWLSFEMKPGMIRDSVTLLFAEVHRWIPAGVQVYLLADREFHGVDMLELIEAQGWIPIIRTKGTVTVTRADGSACPLNAWTPAVGQTRFEQAVWLTAHEAGPYTLSASCAPPKRGAKPDPWFIVSTLPAGAAILHLYEKRFWIDETFRDFKGYGFHLGNTGISDPGRLDRLVLIIALACWWVLSIGIWVHRMGLHAEVDRTKHPRLSLFQLGLRYINRLLHLGHVPDVRLIPELIGAL
jgi:hypothetical protein